MGKINSATGLSICIFLFISFSLNAQNPAHKKPISELFHALQSKYQVQFNYDEALVSGITLEAPPNNLSLDEILSYFEKHTRLVFSVLNKNLILVNQKPPLLLCGFLKNIENHDPIESATIQGILNSTTSDSSGYFQLEMSQNKDSITIRHIGFKTLVAAFNDLKSGECSEIFLQPKFQNLSEVIVSNYITNGINKLNDGAYEMNFSNFGILPGLVESDVLKLIQAFPGIHSINETVSNINIRGGTNDQNLILWDDIKMYQSGHFFGLISMFNPQITQKVMLTKNGTDVSYTDGVSGTISMQTEEQVNSNFKGNIGVNFTDINGFSDIPIGRNSSLQVAARKSLSDFVKTPTYREFFERISQNTEVESNNSNITNSDKRFDFYDTSLRWIYNMSEKDFLKVNFINVSNTLRFNENTVVDNQEKSKQSEVSQNSIAEGIQYKRLWNKNFTSTLEAYETDYKLRAVNENILASQRYLQENKVSETSIKLITELKINNSFTLLNGYQFIETEITNLDDVDNPIYRKKISEVLRIHGLFSNLGFRSKSTKTNLDFGLRANYIEKFNKTIIEPRFSFNQRFLEYFTFEILGEFKNQSTSQIINFQNDFLGIERRRWQLSNNQDIPILRSQQFSTGLNFSKAGWLLSTEVYEKRVNGITAQSQGFLNQYEFVKSHGSYKIFGLDFLIRKRLHKFNTWMSYSFMDNTYDFEDFEPYPFPSNFNIEHSMSLGTSFKTKNLKIAVGLNWHTGKPTTEPVDGDNIVDNKIIYKDPNSSSLDDYWKFDLSALYNIKINPNTHANLGASIWNLFNVDNIINNYYHIENNSVKEVKQHSLGLTTNLVLRVFFN
ncbi:TonB-dependent receptor plug domain-containing protein [Gaetbulibacter aestuarii]|uniref:TonB-dependent receptor n=1 Tax=Gaetbulibacter aestuarii TaxID=1502358 RepID=A0ABW7MWE0_9FLAO